MEAYDNDLNFEHDDDGFQVDEPTSTNDDVESRVKQMCRPYTSQEPSLSSEELSSLDSLADQVDRLRDLGVLLPVSTLDGCQETHDSLRADVA